jgi:hypothetical protein
MPTTPTSSVHPQLSAFMETPQSEATSIISFDIELRVLLDAGLRMYPGRDASRKEIERWSIDGRQWAEQVINLLSERARLLEATSSMR